VIDESFSHHPVIPGDQGSFVPDKASGERGTRSMGQFEIDLYVGCFSFTMEG
jgi:hypothetical protein